MDKKGKSLRWLPYVAAPVIFLLVSMLYFAPQFSGEKLDMHDVTQYVGASADIERHVEQYGEDPQWTGSSFSGMPSYMIDFKVPAWLIRHASKLPVRAMGEPAVLIFTAMLCFWLMTLLWKVNPWVGIVPALAYGFSTYTILIIGAGHISKVWAMAYIPLLIGAIVYTYRGRHLWFGAALAALADPAAFARRWPAAKGQQPMVLAVGDGNHSLATAKAYWEELKPTLSEEQRRTHPARWCLAEVCNVHSSAIEIEPIHRVVFGVGAKELYAALDAWDQQQGSSTTMSDQRLRLADAHGESAVALANPPAPLTVGSVEAFLADFLPAHPGVTVDYIHGESTALALASEPAKPATAILLPDFAKADLFKGVVLGGVLPRKTFSMGHAEEKRYYIECRRIKE